MSHPNVADIHGEKKKNSIDPSPDNADYNAGHVDGWVLTLPHIPPASHSTGHEQAAATIYRQRRQRAGDVRIDAFVPKDVDLQIKLLMGRHGYTKTDIIPLLIKHGLSVMDDHDLLDGCEEKKRSA